MSPKSWSSRWSVWASKRGILKIDAGMTEYQRLGLYLEPVITQLYAEETGREVITPPANTIYRGAHHWQIATLDRLDQPGALDAGVVQLKTCGRNYGDWADGPPLHYQVQLQHEMAVAGVTRGSFAVLFGAPAFSFRVYDLVRNDDFIAALEKVEREFWDMVLGDVAPPVDDSPATTEAVRRIRANPLTETTLPDEARQWVGKLTQVKRIEKRIESRRNLLENSIKSAMGSAELALLDNTPAFTWKTDKGGTRRFRQLISESLEQE